MAYGEEESQRGRGWGKREGGREKRRGEKSRGGKGRSGRREGRGERARGKDGWWGWGERAARVEPEREKGESLGKRKLRVARLEVEGWRRVGGWREGWRKRQGE